MKITFLNLNQYWIKTNTVYIGGSVKYPDNINQVPVRFKDNKTFAVYDDTRKMRKIMMRMARWK